MTKTKKPEDIKATAIPTKHQQVINLLKRKGGATIEELSTLANWLPHSARAYMNGLKKKGHVIESDKVDGVRRYRISSSAA
jgi:predicted transcriptional regulator